MLAILAPIDIEISGIRRDVGHAGSTRISLHVTGIGQRSTVDNVGRIAASRPDGMLMMGFCGATHPRLRTGDLHIPRTFLCPERDAAIPADPEQVAAIYVVARRQHVGITTQPTATVSEVANPNAKLRLQKSFGADSVNMEDYWAAEVASAAGIPFASVRVILDTATEELPDYLLNTGDNPARAVFEAIARPNRVFQLIRLARKVQVARRNLTRCVSDLVRSISAGQSPAMVENP